VGRGRSYAELAVGVVAPALDGSVVEDGAGVCGSYGDALGGAGRAEVDAEEVVAHVGERGALVVRDAQA
jgi:hypothetical protein